MQNQTLSIVERMAMDLTTWIPTAISLALAIMFFASKNWIKSSIEKSIQHSFDEKIENLRSSLRNRENEISVLRERVLSGRATREELMDRRRLKAVERVWAAVAAYAPLETASRSMAYINFSEAAKGTREASHQKFFDIIGGSLPLEKIPDSPAKNERPFVTPLAWSYLSAYQAIVVSGFMRAKMLATTTGDISKLFTAEPLRELLKAALPHQSQFIDENEPETFYFLVDEVKANLLAELKRILDGTAIDEENIVRSTQIMKAVGDMAAANRRGEAEAKTSE
jgi:hypothetical protein